MEVRALGRAEIRPRWRLDAGDTSYVWLSMRTVTTCLTNWASPGRIQPTPANFRDSSPLWSSIRRTVKKWPRSESNRSFTPYRTDDDSECARYVRRCGHVDHRARGCRASGRWSLASCFSDSLPRRPGSACSSALASGVLQKNERLRGSGPGATDGGLTHRLLPSRHASGSRAAPSVRILMRSRTTRPLDGTQ